MCLYWANIAESGPTLKQHIMFAERSVMLMCGEQCTLITATDGQ